jgi:hypothetical protein
MPDSQDGRAPVGGRTLAIMVGAILVVFIILVWGPWNVTHVASNPGPSGIPGSTTIEPAPPPADGPSESTTGSAR